MSGTPRQKMLRISKSINTIASLLDIYTDNYRPSQLFADDRLNQMDKLVGNLAVEIRLFENALHDAYEDEQGGGDD